MKSNLKIIYFFTLISILLYFSSFDEVSGVHKTGDDIIHTNIYELKIKSSPPGLQFNNSAMYEDGVWVEIDVAQKKWGAYNFVGWSIDKNRVDGNPITVLMDKDHTATAIYAIHPAKNQDSVSFTQDKNAYDLTIISAYGKTLGSGSYYNGEIVYFRVLDQYVSDEIYEGVRYAFSKWSDGYNPNLMSNFIKMNGSKIITTDWSKQYRLEILDSNQNMKVVSTSWHSANSTAPLVMSSFETEFDGQVKHKINEWISVGSNHAVIKDPKNSITSVVMDNPYSISVDWKNQFYLNINSKYGKVEGSGFYDEGDMIVATIDSEIQKTGISGTRLIFDGWSGDASSDGTNVQIMMNEPKSIEGKWKKQFELVVNSKYGNPNGAGWYDEGEIATFGTNIPREPIGFWQQNTFQGWSGDAEIESNTGVILMNGPKIITAKWGIDYFIAFMNIGIISSTAIGGLFIYKKMKKGKKQEKLTQKDTNESTLIKTKKQGLSGITKELATKINSKMKFDNNQDLIQNYTMKKISDDVKPQNKEGLQEKEILEKSIGEVEFEKREIIINLEKRLAEMKLETKKTSIELENNLAEVELGKKSLANKTEQLEKSLFKVELQKKNISEEKEILEKSIGDIELEKKRIAAELERKEATFEFERQATSQRTSELENRISKAEIEKKLVEAELQKNITGIEFEKNSLTQKTERLEKSIAGVEIEKKNISEEKKILEKSIGDIELEKKIISDEVERKEIEIKFSKMNLEQKTEQIEKKIIEVENQKKKNGIEINKNFKAVELQKKGTIQREVDLEKNIIAVEMAKKQLFQKTEQLEKSIAGVEIEREYVLKEKKSLEKNIERVEYQKREMVVGFERKMHEVEIVKKELEIKFEKISSKVEVQKNNFSQKTEQLEKSIAGVEIERENTLKERETLEKSIIDTQLEKKRITDEVEKKELEIKFSKMNVEQKTEQIEKILTKVKIEKKNLAIKTDEIEKKLSEIKLEKKKLSAELEKSESLIELEKKNINKNAWELEKRIGKFTLEMNMAAIDMEKKRIASELERKELVIELEKEDIFQRKKELEKSIAAVEIEKDITPTEVKIQKNTKLNDKNTPNSKYLKNIISEIELARKVATSEIERKESIIELEKKNLAIKTEILEKRISRIEIEKRISSVQLEKLEVEIKIEKKNLEQRVREFGKNVATKNTGGVKKKWDYSYSILDSEHNSYEKFRQWANVLEYELAIKETPDKKKLNDYLGDMK